MRRGVRGIMIDQSLQRTLGLFRRPVLEQKLTAAAQRLEIIRVIRDAPVQPRAGVGDATRLDRRAAFDEQTLCTQCLIILEHARESR